MKQYQKDILDTFKGVFSLLMVIVILLGSFITLIAGASAGSVFIISLIVPVFVTSLALATIAGVRVNRKI